MCINLSETDSSDDNVPLSNTNNKKTFLEFPRISRKSWKKNVFQ